MDIRYFGLKMRNGSSPPRRGRKRSSSSGNINNSADLPNHYLNHQSGHFPGSNSSNMLLFQNPNQGNQRSSQSGYSSPSFGYSLPSASPPPEYRPHKMMKFGDNNRHPGATLMSNPSDPFSNAVTMPLQNQQREKDRVQEKWDADWLTLSLGSSSWQEAEAVEDEELDLELKL